MYRRPTRPVSVGDLTIGGDAPIVVQSMLNAPQGDIEANVAQARELSAAGCQMVRLSVTNFRDIDTVRALKEAVKIPLVADIQMNYELALASLDAGIDKIRINPRYIGGPDKVRLVADSCKAHGVPIRVGVNSGSVEKELLETYGGVTPEAMAESALKSVRILEEADFHDIVISIKSSDIRTMLAAYRLV
ncbi:MAG: flavodoxin-dependent (E)-4-hydroxy-3-methylbut-2-enyl-diphosphate synthase, partial [Clostridia bacterium]|nr:flavodoxin-dependent (E)-4-hydroxy-3-methylbut-2-enyl-diphosphate synthase [Clostridia bacterium]